MPIFGLFWVNSWISCLLGYSQDLFRVPDYLTSALPARVLSVVGSPLENYHPLLVPSVGTRLSPISNTSSHVNTLSPTSLATFGFQGGFGRSESPPKQAQSSVQSISLPNGLEDKLCHPASEQNKNSQSVTPRSSFSSNAELRPEEAGRSASKPSFPQRVLQLMQSLFQWPERLESSLHPKPKPVVVIRIGDNEEVIPAPASDTTVARRGFWLYSLMRPGRRVASLMPKEQWPQVLVNGHLIAQVPDWEQAKSMAENLHKILANSDLDVSQMQPTLVEGIPGGRLGESILFVVSEAIAKHLDRSPQLLAIEWVNNLRSALGTAPLTLVQAQSRMYNLVETERKIEGLASWYGGYFHGRPTATGEKFNQFALTAAHPSLPFDTYLKVTNLGNGDAVIVRVNDRGPYVPPRSLDLSLGAARCIRSENTGVVPYSAVIMQPLVTP